MSHPCATLATRCSRRLLNVPPLACCSCLDGSSAPAVTRPRRRPFSSAPLASPLKHPSAPSSTSSPRSQPTSFGQPLPATHPHLLQQGELTIGIPYSEYEARRRKLMENLPNGSVVVLAGGRLQYSSQSIFYKFRQLSDFIYLTGWLEQDAAVVLEKRPSLPRGYKMTFFCRSRDAEAEEWEGPRNGPSGAVDIFGADNAMDIALFTSHLKAILTSDNTSGNIYVDLPDTPLSSSRATRTRSASKTIMNFLSGGAAGVRRNSLDMGLSQKKSDYETVVSLLNGSGGRTVLSLREQTEKLRIIKSENEIKLMKRAAAISGDAHAKVMRMAAPGVSEHSLVSLFEYECAKQGSERAAYLPVCASGSNTRFLHYTSNNALLSPHSLVLLDAGCEYANYASDITRTFPVSGRFSEPEKDLYTAVLETVKACTSLCAERRNVNLYDLHEQSRKTLREELRQIGVEVNEAVFGRIYPHFVGHPLGLDLHEAPSFQRSTRLDAGNVITIEPGVYMPDDSSIPLQFRNLCIRLEEEVLVGKEHPEILSNTAPIEVSDVEACCQEVLESREGQGWW